MIQSLSQQRRIALQLQSRTTEELLDLRERLTRNTELINPDLPELVNAELDRRRNAETKDSR